MNHLAVEVRWHGSPVIDRVVRLSDGLVLGDAEGAAVAFPGATLRVRRVAEGWRVGCRVVGEGQVVRLRSGALHLRLEGVAERPFLARGGGADPVPLVLTVAVLLIAASLDAVARVAHEHPELAEQLRALLLATR